MNKTFEENINDVRTARRGVEVREAMAESLEYVEGFASTATQKAEEAATSAKTAAEAKEAAVASAQTAEQQAGIATQQAEAAESSKAAAAESAKRAERFAVETEGRVTTDKTLTVSGAAADAAATGVRLRMLEMTLGTPVEGSTFMTAFDTLDGVELTGVWNKAASRVEF